MHEYNECYLYHSFMETESDTQVRHLWELHLDMELVHLRVAAELFRRFDGRDPDQVLAPELPPPLTFESNADYVRDLLITQQDVTTRGTGYAREAHERFEAMQHAVMDGERPPSERVIDENRAISGAEYRLEQQLSP